VSGAVFAYTWRHAYIYKQNRQKVIPSNMLLYLLIFVVVLIVLSQYMFMVFVGQSILRSVLKPMLQHTWSLFFPKRPESMSLESYVALKGYNYHIGKTSLHGPGYFFTNDAASSYADVIVGSIGDKPFRFFTQFRPTASSMYTDVIERTIVEVTLPYKFPHIVINSTVDRHDTFPVRHSGYHKVVFSYEFSKYFEVFTNNKNHTELFEILSPNILAAIIGHAGDADIEIIEDKV